MENSKKFATAFFLGLILWLAVPSQAHAIVITFEGLADLETVTNQYAGQGVSFVNATAAVAPPGGTLNEIDFPPTSGVTVVTNEVDTDADDFVDSVGDIDILFSTYFTNVSGYTVYSDLAKSGDPLNIKIFSPSDLVNPFISFFYGENLGTPGIFGVSGPTPIARILLSGGAGSYFTLDDLSFSDPFVPSGTAVPEPATLALVSLGGLGLVSRRKKHS